MAKQDMETLAAAAAAMEAPSHVAAAAFGVGGAVELLVTVSEKNGIKAYGFAVDGAPVVMSNGKGRFFAPSGVAKRLEWVMVGDPGATMRVAVTQAGVALKDRQSRIAPPYAKGYDAFTITAN